MFLALPAVELLTLWQVCSGVALSSRGNAGAWSRQQQVSGGADSAFASRSDGAAHEWAEGQGDSGRSGRTAARGLPAIRPDLVPRWKWRDPSNSQIRASPLIDADKNYYIAVVGGRSGSALFKLSGATGSEVWTVRTAGPIPDTPVLHQGAVIFCTQRAWVVSVNAATGTEIWRKKIGRFTGGDAWSTSAGGGVVIAAAAEKNVPVIDLNVGNHVVVALNASTGDIIWTHRPTFPLLNFRAAIRANGLVFADARGQTTALHLKTGKTLWQSSLDTGAAGLSSGGAVIGPNSMVYVTSNTLKQPDRLAMLTLVMRSNAQHGLLRAFHLSNGSLAWDAKLPLQANTLPAVGYLQPNDAGPLAVVVSLGKYPKILPATLNGYKLMSTGVDIGPMFQPEITPPRVLALGAETGSLLWTWEHTIFSPETKGAEFRRNYTDNMMNVWTSPVIDGDGNVYVGFHDGKLHSVRDANSDGYINATTEVPSVDLGNPMHSSFGIVDKCIAAATSCELYSFCAADT